MHTTQRQQVHAMLKCGPLTPLDALETIGCFRLAARIKELRDAGVPITTTRITKNGKTFAQYHLAK